LFSHDSMSVAAQIIAKKYSSLLSKPMKDDDPEVVGYRYGEYVNTYVGQPIGAVFYQAKNLETDAWPNEVWYKSLLMNPDPEWNRDWKPGIPQVSQAYGIDFFARPGSGTIVAAGRDVARFLNNYWLNGIEKTPANLAGITWGSTGYGSLPGTTSIIVDQ